MERTFAKDLKGCYEERVLIKGWLHAVRPLGKLNFVILRDATGLAQVVVEDKEELKKVRGLQPGSILTVEGSVAKTSMADLGCEIVDPKIEVEEGITDVPVIEYAKPEIPSDLEFILDHRTLALRNRKIAAVFKIQAEIGHAFRIYMHDYVHATEYHPPCLIGASSEGGSEFFSVDYFGHEATLAQSSQLYKQIMVGVYERVYGIIPFFRAEPSHTTRHLTEGKQLEFEMGFFESWLEVLDVEEGCIKYILGWIQERCAEELKVLDVTLPAAPEDTPFPRVTFAEAQEIYYTRSGFDERSEPDLSPAAERELCRYAKETFGADFIFVTDWLWAKRPFYSYKNPENPKLTNTFDLLCCGMEITSGGQRCHTFSAMEAGILEKGMDPADFTDYLAIFKFGMPPHGGFGLGLERITMTFLGLKNIREASLFPSDPKRVAGNRLKADIFFGGENIRGEIIRQLKEKECDFSHLVHEKTPTSEDSAKARGENVEDGIKVIIVCGKKSKKNYMFCFRADKKLDMKAVQNIVGEKCEFEKPDVIEERFGLTLGSIPPFGHLIGIATYFDRGVSQGDKAAFNCGLLTESVVMHTPDLIALVDPSQDSFVKK